MQQQGHTLYAPKDRAVPHEHRAALCAHIHSRMKLARKERTACNWLVPKHLMTGAGDDMQQADVAAAAAAGAAK